MQKKGQMAKESSDSWTSRAWGKEGEREEPPLWILLFQRPCLHFPPLSPFLSAETKNSRNIDKQFTRHDCRQVAQEPLDMLDKKQATVASQGGDRP